jgi:serine/threonine protein kinase
VSGSGDPRIGTKLAGYRIEGVLGRGGMGVVYLAEDVRLKRKVALKVLAPAIAEDEAFRERFLRESELAASLDHPSIIPIYEAGEADGKVFIAMRYVEGRERRHGSTTPRRSRSPSCGPASSHWSWPTSRRGRGNSSTRCRRRPACSKARRGGRSRRSPPAATSPDACCRAAWP